MPSAPRRRDRATICTEALRVVSAAIGPIEQRHIAAATEASSARDELRRIMKRALEVAAAPLEAEVRRCGVQPAEIGVLHLSPSLLDRSKSMKTELMTLLEADGHADAEGRGERCFARRRTPAWEG